MPRHSTFIWKHACQIEGSTKRERLMKKDLIVQASTSVLMYLNHHHHHHHANLLHHNSFLFSLSFFSCLFFTKMKTAMCISTTWEGTTLRGPVLRQCPKKCSKKLGSITPLTISLGWKMSFLFKIASF